MGLTVAGTMMGPDPGRRPQIGEALSQLGRQLGDARLAARLQLRDVAAVAGRTDTRWAQVEAGDPDAVGSLTIVVLARVAHALGVDVFGGGRP